MARDGDLPLNVGEMGFCPEEKGDFGPAGKNGSFPNKMGDLGAGASAREKLSGAKEGDFGTVAGEFGAKEMGEFGAKSSKNPPLTETGEVTTGDLGESSKKLPLKTGEIGEFGTSPFIPFKTGELGEPEPMGELREPEPVGELGGGKEPLPIGGGVKTAEPVSIGDFTAGDLRALLS